MLVVKTAQDCKIIELHFFENDKKSTLKIVGQRTKHIERYFDHQIHINYLTFLFVQDMTLSCI